MRHGLSVTLFLLHLTQLDSDHHLGQRGQTAVVTCSPSSITPMPVLKLPLPRKADEAMESSRALEIWTKTVISHAGHHLIVHMGPGSGGRAQSL